MVVYIDVLSSSVVFWIFGDAYSSLVIHKELYAFRSLYIEYLLKAAKKP